MPNRVSRFFRVAPLLLFLFWTGCLDLDNITDSNESSAEEAFSFDINVQNHTGFKLAGITGTVTVIGNAGTTVVGITGKRRVRAESVSHAREYLKMLQVNVQDLGNEVSVETVQPKDTQGRAYIVDYTIVLPKSFRIQVTNVTGNVSVSSISNAVLVSSVTGNVTLNQIVGNATVSLVTGIIDGSVTVPANGIVDFSTVTGSINLRIPANTSAQVSASVTTGSIVTSNLLFQSQTGTSTSFAGRLGDGKGTITLKTVTGGISIVGL